MTPEDKPMVDCVIGLNEVRALPNGLFVWLRPEARKFKVTVSDKPLGPPTVKHRKYACTRDRERLE